MQKDNERNDLVDEFLRREDFAPRYKIYKELDADAAFSRFEKRVGVKTNAGHRTLVRWSLGVAASVAAAVLIGFAVYGLQTDETVTDDFMVSITPGYGHAILTTSDGSRVALTGDGALLDTMKVASADELSADNSQMIIEVPRGGEYCITLSDGTKVHLNSESSIEFPRVFGGNTRSVKLRGEACFEVAHMDNCPFVVDAHGVKVKEYGTQFNVQAYSHERVEVTLVEGSIGVVVPFRGESRLTPGRQAVVCGSDIKISDVDVDNVTGWTEGVFRFDNKELGEIAEILSRWYDVSIVVDDKISHAHFSGSLERDGKIGDILDAIAEITGMKYTNDNSTIILHK